MWVAVSSSAQIAGAACIMLDHACLVPMSPEVLKLVHAGLLEIAKVVCNLKVDMIRLSLHTVVRQDMCNESSSGMYSGASTGTNATSALRSCSWPESAQSPCAAKGAPPSITPVVNASLRPSGQGSAALRCTALPVLYLGLCSGLLH